MEQATNMAFWQVARSCFKDESSVFISPWPSPPAALWPELELAPAFALASIVSGTHQSCAPIV
eukprot:9983078-Alexandrium_andersonii.AAC.1